MPTLASLEIVAMLGMLCSSFHVMISVINILLARSCGLVPIQLDQNWCCLGYIAFIYSVKSRDRKMVGNVSGTQT
jgi:hypothetical protein